MACKYKYNNSWYSKEELTNLLLNEDLPKNQTLINLKIAALKELARKYPRSLITSKVVPINPNMVNNGEIQYSKREKIQNIQNEINQLKEELGDVEREGFGALKPIYNFYENTITSILKKQGFKPVEITDEYGNTWNEITITPQMSTEAIRFHSPKLQYTGDLAIEEEIAKLAQETPDEKLPKSIIGKWIQAVRNFFRNIFKEKTTIERFLRDTNQGRTLQNSDKIFTKEKVQKELDKINEEYESEVVRLIDNKVGINVLNVSLDKLENYEDFETKFC